MSIHPYTPKKLIIGTPVYNEWDSFSELVGRLSHVAEKHKFTIHVVAIDDGSTQINPFQKSPFHNKNRLDIVHLARNLGHQKAISIGLAYIQKNITGDVIIVMDSDGEDRPEDIVQLLDAHKENPSSIIFARRARRSEGLVFRIFYYFYRLAFVLFTGENIMFGNFSLLPSDILQRVVHLPEIWNHFASGIMRANLPYICVPIERGIRYFGKSKMNFVSLVVHGLSAMSVYLEVLTVRMIFGVLMVSILDFLGFCGMLYFRFFTPLAIPGWATNVAIGLTIILAQAFLFITMLAFLVLNNRSHGLFIPCRDYKDYVMAVERF